MNNIHNWLERNCDTKLQVQQRTIKRSKCDRTSFEDGFSRIFTMITVQAKIILCSLIPLITTPADSQINPDNTLEQKVLPSYKTFQLTVSNMTLDSIEVFHLVKEFDSIWNRERA